MRSSVIPVDATPPAPDMAAQPADAVTAASTTQAKIRNPVMGIPPLVARLPRAGPGQLREWARDADDLVEPEDAAPDDRDEQAAGQPGRARLGGVRHERDAPRGVTVGEVREAHALAVGGEGEDLAALTIRDIDESAGPHGEALRHRPFQHEASLTARTHVPDLALARLPGRLRAAVGADPQVVGLVHREHARPDDPHVVERLPGGVEPDHQAAIPVGDV